MATVEVIHFRPKPDTDIEEFKREDARVGHEYTPPQPGFISRESAMNDDGDWVVIVHWTDPESAQASMELFPNHPTATRFLELMDMDTFSMIRYEVLLNT